ncbi:MAG: hypothetical protein MJZ30_09980 [Paludibacteraceae bacterium]|nr:hypothetical protein [Paludibacteraceae bacterium]
MSVSKAIKQVLSIVKQMRDALLGKKVYKSFKVTNIKVTDVFAQIFQLLNPDKPFTLTDYNVLGYFPDETHFNGLCIEICIPPQQFDILPQGGVFRIPAPLLFIFTDGKTTKIEITDDYIASLISVKESPWEWAGSSELFFGEIDLTDVIAVAGEFEYKQLPDYVCEIEIVESVTRDSTGYAPRCQDGIKPQFSSILDNNNRIGRSVMILGTDGEIKLGSPVYNNTREEQGIIVPRYELEIEQGEYAVVLDVVVDDVQKLYIMAGTDMDYYTEWVKKHQISSCVFSGAGQATLSRFSGSKGILNLVIGIFAPQTSPANE